MHKAVPVALAGLLISMAGVVPAASAQSRGHDHEEHEGIPYVMAVAGKATNIKSRASLDSSAMVHLETTKANENAVSFKAVEGELKIGEDTYSITGGKANLALKSGRMSMTIMLDDGSGKVQLLRITARLADPLPHEGDEPAVLSFKVAKALKFWKLDMRGEMALAEAGA
jgi:hypothetical protein